MTDRLLLAQISVDVRDIQKQMNRAGLSVDTASRRMAQTWRTNTNAMARDTEQFGRDVARAITAIGLTAAAGQITSLADAWTRAGNQISAAAAATGTAAASLSSVAAIARSTRTEFEATATLYARLTRATGDLGASQEQVAEATRLINQAFVAGGASATEQASAVLQLSQALQSGVLQGDELRSLRESSPIILAAIAKEFGVAQGALKALGAEGKLTSDKIFTAILKAAPEIEAQFAVTQTTVADSFTNLRTAAVEYVGELNSSLGVTAGFNQVVNGLADNFEVFADALLVSVALLGARGLGGALNGAIASGVAYARSMKDRSRETIEAYRRERDEAAERADTISRSLEKEKRALADLGRERARLQKVVEGGPKLFAQYGELKTATDEAAKAQANLNAVLGNSKSTLEDISRATLARNAAEEKLARLQEKAFANARRLDVVDREYEATQKRITAGQRALAGAKTATANAARQLSRAMDGIGRAGASVLNFFGGPIGVALIGVTAAFAYFESKVIASERAIRNMTSALEILSRANLNNAQLSENAADASAELTAQMENQKKAALALEAIERRRLQLDYAKGLKGARDEVKRLESEIRILGKALDESKAFNTPNLAIEKAFADANNELAQSITYLAILQDGLAGLEANNYSMKGVSDALPSASTEDLFVSSENPLKAELQTVRNNIETQTKLREEAAKENERILESIRSAYNDLYTWRDEQIRADLARELKAIDASGKSAKEKEELRVKARAVADAKLREYHEEEIEAAEEARKASEDAAQREIDLLSQIMNERDRMLGRFISISAREYAQRRADIEKNITDEARRNEALRALAEEEAEFRRQVRADVAALDQRSDDGSQIAAVQESMRQKLQFMQEAQAMELAALQENEEAKLALIEEYEALRREIIADSEAEIQAIRTASADMLLSASSNLFGNLANLARTFAGESSGIFKALFFAEKAFALASAYVNMQLAIAKANASAPPPLNAHAILAAKVTGAAAIAGIIASTAAGFKKGGYTGDGNPNDPAGIVHRGEFVVPAKAVKAIGRQNLESLRFGQLPRSSIPGAVRPSPARNVSFGDMILNVSGEGAAEIRDELAGMLAAHRSAVARDIDRGFGSMLTRELKTTTPRHERRRP